MECINEKKTKKLMQKFIDTASDLSIKIYVEKDDSFKADCPDGKLEDCEEKIHINYNFDDMNDIADKVYRKVWTTAYPYLKGFANITINLLHELGHLEIHNQIREQYSYAQREYDINTLDNSNLPAILQMIAYCMLPDERAASEWMAEWLSDKENRKLAKKFEKEFFTYFERE